MRTCTPLELMDNINQVIDARLVPAVWGSPGTGKSNIIASLAKARNYELIDLRLSQLEAVDLNGLPSNSDGRLVWLPPAVFPLELDLLPENKDGWLLFLDEINSAGLEVQKAAYKLLLDRMVGQYRLHPACHIVVAGNLISDRAITTRMPTPLMSRLIHFQIEVDPKQWVLWAEQHNIDARIVAYIRYMPDKLYKFDPDTNDNTYPCPRTWEFASRLIYGKQDVSITLLAGVIGEGAAVEFVEAISVFDKLPNLRDILNDPKNASMVDEPSMTYALFSMIISKIDGSNADALFVYAQRYAMEFQYFLFTQLNSLLQQSKAAKDDKIFTRVAGALRTRAAIEWMLKYAEEML